MFCLEERQGMLVNDASSLYGDGTTCKIITLWSWGQWCGVNGLFVVADCVLCTLAMVGGGVLPRY